ncbi:hypothetical protein CAter282_1812 [Collimonas arenae]|uniref:Uncharacterized protein n=1 Tax=Collimonas arenae TaxID=279058 RepID=A0A127QHP6_9BURK|nr:hypothetical protein CAter282_1812 [Collimonas arenae]
MPFLEVYGVNGAGDARTYLNPVDGFHPAGKIVHSVTDFSRAAATDTDAGGGAPSAGLAARLVKVKVPAAAMMRIPTAMAIALRENNGVEVCM